MKKLFTVLGIALSGFLVYLFEKIWGNSINWESIREVQLGKLITYEFNFALYEILLFFFFVSLIYFIGKKILFKKKNHYTKKQNQLRKINKQHFTNEEVLARWTVLFDNDTPVIDDLTLFCTKHGNALRFLNNKCTVSGCSNNSGSLEYDKIENLIESMLIHKWDELNK